MIAFIIGSSRFILVSSAAIWYFNRMDPSKSRNPIGTSVWWLVVYHGGSVAFGSLLLSVIWLVQIITEYIAVRRVSSRKK